MHVDQTGADDQTGCVDELIGDAGFVVDGDDAPVTDQKIPLPVDVLTGRINPNSSYIRTV